MSEAVTFRALQVEFARLWHSGQILPESVTISEADFDPFFESLYPKKEWTDFERSLLGAEKIAELDDRREHGRKHIAGITNYVNGGIVRLIRDEKLPTGAFSIGYPTTDFEWEGGEQ